jgi:hypothetical protein
MFDKTISFEATDGSVELTIEAGTEGVKSITVLAGAVSKSITAQQLIDLAAPQLKAYVGGANVASTPAPPGAPGGCVS